MARYTLTFEDKNVNAGSIDRYDDMDGFCKRFWDLMNKARYFQNVRVDIAAEDPKEDPTCYIRDFEDCKTIKILGVPYTVQEVNQISKDELTLGQVNYIPQIIKLDATLEKETKQATLLHEIIHAILFTCGMHEENKDENLIQIIAMGLNQVLSENKDLFFT